MPGQPNPIELPVTKLDSIGRLGLLSRDITGPAPRGPFTKIAPSPTATYPALWNHNAKKETKIICEPDAQLQVKQGLEEKAAEVWKTASRVHLNSEYTLGSQPLCVAFTEQETIGGHVWPNVILNDKRFDYAFTVWGNSTLGMLLYWWHSNRQQSSKIRMSIRSAESLPILDIHTLTNEQLITAQTIFKKFRNKDLQPAYLSDTDPNRALLDRHVIYDLLGFDKSTYQAVRRLCAKWCAEPSVHGGKKRPPKARLVM